MEAVRTNINGTENVLRAAACNGVARVVVLSTDKAVYPINAMGMTKALAEKVVIANSRLQPDNGTIFCATRYGNVMASRGSVIPVFVDQIKRGKPITVTDPNMTRFLMSLEDSVDLVLHAFEHARQGDIFVQKAPASTMRDLAQALKDISNQMHEINDLNVQIADATEQQNLAAEEINHSVIGIRDNAEESLKDAHRSKQVSEELLTLARSLDEQVRSFKVD